VAGAMAEDLGWSGRGVKQAAEAWLAAADEEGLVPREPSPALRAAS
jgi:hypothetical protein